LVKFTVKKEYLADSYKLLEDKRVLYMDCNAVDDVRRRCMW